MVSIIKNQLLKHLSRFTKNLSSDKINLSTFRGEGELSNLELDEAVLTDLLELPSWLRLTEALCNKVNFTISWTKLKSVPIILRLDEVNITVETCEELRSMSPQGGLSSYPVPGKYSYIHKIIDGITITVNTVNVLFKSPAFTASVQISRIIVQSKSPNWNHADLSATRVKDQPKQHMLLFKELEWQTLKIEAKSTIDENLTPLRLITNQARCRIVIKKRLADCFIVGSRLVVILDDLLWVLTDSQLKAALHFLDSLSGLIQKATSITRIEKAARKLEEIPEYKAEAAKSNEKKGLFYQTDVVETSYHFLSNKIVLHLCDDAGKGRSSHPNLQDGGALQICVKRFKVDFFPYHLAKSSRKHWPRYDPTTCHAMWQEQALSHFKSKFLDLIDKTNVQHTPLSRSPKPVDLTSPPGDPNKRSPNNQKDLKRRIEHALSHLMTTCVIMRIEDFTLYKVTTTSKKALKEFITGDRDRMQLPKESSIVHSEFIYYYYPNDTPFPIPPPKFYVQFNPIQVIFDVESCLWLNSFGLNLYESLNAAKRNNQLSNYTYVDVKVEAILPRITFESAQEYSNQRDRPKSLSIEVTRATITNVRSLEHSSRADLGKCVDSFHMGSLFFGSEFPSRPGDYYIVTQKFLDHITADDNVRKIPQELNTSSLEALCEQLSRELLWTEAKDVWCLSLEPISGDFYGTRAAGVNKTVPLFDCVPVTVWLHALMDPNSTIKASSSKNAQIHALAYIANLVSIQINHYQYLFLLKLADDVAELTTFLTIDSDRIQKESTKSSIVIGALLPQLEVTFVMPSQCPGKESSGGDIESFVPDSSSIPDDVLVGSSATVWQTSTLSMENTHRKTLPNGSGTPLKLSSSFSMDYVQTPTPMKPPINIQNNLNAGISSVKKGFSTFMSSIDNAIMKQIPDDLSDTVSVKSDASSDCDFHVVQNDVENPTDSMFVVREFCCDSSSDVEMASEVIEEESTVTSTSEHSFPSSCRRKDLVSVSTFKLNKVEFLQQSSGYSSAIKVQIAGVTCEDCASIPWDEFQSKFSTRTKAWSDNPLNISESSKIKLRLDHNLTLPSSPSQINLVKDRDSISKNNLLIEVHDFDLKLGMSTLTGLADLTEEEVIAPIIPTQISVRNINLHLIEDRPPVNITSPGPIPIFLNVTEMYITRSQDGIFHINTKIPSASRQTLQQAKQASETEEYKRRLMAFERVSEENCRLRKEQEDIDVLKAQLKYNQDKVAQLLNEKENLLDTIKKLKEQCPSTEKNAKR